MSNLSVLIQLLRRDLVSIRRKFLGNLLDSASVLFCLLIVFGYLMSSYGLGSDYGPFLLVSAIASFGFLGTISKVFNLITDIEGDRTISYTLTLPLPSWLVFAYVGFVWAVDSLLTSIFLFPLGKIILFNQFDLSKISYLKLIPIYITMNLFYGFFSLWLTSILKKMGDVGHLWIRVINPLIMFGAYYYSWDAIYQISPTLARIHLINPLVYVMEGMRSAVIGSSHFIPFWISFTMLWAFTIAFAWHGVSRLQKRLDCVK